MADDITARISIAVENADAVQKCAEIEKGLQKVTDARRDDVAAAKDQVQAAKKEAEAFDFSAEGHAQHRKKLLEELEAAKALAKEQERLNKTTKEYEKGISANEARRQMGMPELTNEQEERLHRERLRRANEYNATLNAQKPTALASNSNEAAQQERAERILAQRKEDEKLLSDEIKKRTNTSEKAIAQEIAQQNILIAKKRLQVAVEKELALLQKKKLTEQSLATAKSTGNKAGVAGASKALEQINRELIDARSSALNAAAGVKAAEKAFATIGDTTTATARQANVLLRALRAVGRSMGVSVAESPKLGGGAKISPAAMTGLAGVAAFTAVMKLHSALANLRQEAMQAEKVLRDFASEQITRALDDLQNRAAGEKSLFQDFKNLNSSIEDNAVNQLKMSELLERLNQSLYDFRLELDHTGRATNIYTASVTAQQKIMTQQLDMLKAQEKGKQREIDQISEIVGQAGGAKGGRGSTWGTRGLHWLGLHKTAQLLEDANAYFVDKALFRYNEVESAQARILALTKEQDDISRRIISLEKERANIYSKALADARLATAQFVDEIKKYKERIKSSQDSVIKHQDLGAWYEKIAAVSSDKIKEINNLLKELNKEESNLNKLLEKMREGKSNTIKIGKSVKTDLEIQELLLNNRRDATKLLRELAKFKQQDAQIQIRNINIDRTLFDIERSVELLEKEMKGIGKLTIEREKLKLQRDALQKRQGWGKDKADKWLELKTKELVIRNQKVEKSNSETFFKSIFDSIFKFQSSIQGAVLANSIEAVQLQSRMLNSKSYQQQVIDITKQQFATLQRIEYNTHRNIGVTV